MLEIVFFVIETKQPKQISLKTVIPYTSKFFIALSIVFVALSIVFLYALHGATDNIKKWPF